MSKKKSKKSKRKSLPGAAASVAAAMRASMKHGGYGPSIAAKAMGEAFGRQTLGMYGPKSPSVALTPAEKKAQAAVLRALSVGAARAARLPGKKSTKGKSKASKVAPKKKAGHKRVAAPPPKKAARKKVRTVTADQAVNEAAQKALKRWLCEGPRRSGCGSGGTRVVTGKGSFVRLRPFFMRSAG